MSSSGDARKQEVLTGFNKILNSHGHAFQHAVVQAAAEVYGEGLSLWAFEGVEFPVEVRRGDRNDTRIDLVMNRRLRYMHGADTRDVYLLAECKRANPSLANWCFVRAPHTRRGTTHHRTFLEKALIDDVGGVSVLQHIQYLGEELASYHIAVEVKTQEQGEAGGSGRGAIEEAATQILRGLNSMIEFLASHTQLFVDKREILFLPVIFTTAKLWVSEADLSFADVLTGNVDLSQSAFTEKPWLFYEYNMSPGLKHSRPYGEDTSGKDYMAEIIEREYVRTIAIVNASSIKGFLVMVSNSIGWH